LHPEKREYAVPQMRDHPGWHAFCLGMEQAYGNVCRYKDDDEDEKEEEEEEEAAGGAPCT
jgi:hypothetical protein